MRLSVWPLILSVAILGLTGCHTGLLGTRKPPEAALPAANNPITTPANPLCGQIARVVQAGRFVVITFPVGHMPAVQQRLNVYRNGLRVGEVRITGPQLDDSTVADLTAGEVQQGDEVRE